MASGAALSQTSATYVSGPGSISTYDFTKAGTLADPWLLSENFTGIGPLVINLSNLQTHPVGPQNDTGSGHSYGKWFSKTVTNNTASAWTSFDLELQSVLGTPSTDGDGLSFAQGAGFAFTSDKFTTVHSIEDVRDFLNFDGGSVGIGESVTFSFAITDNVRSQRVLALGNAEPRGRHDSRAGNLRADAGRARRARVRGATPPARRLIAVAHRPACAAMAEAMFDPQARFGGLFACADASRADADCLGFKRNAARRSASTAAAARRCRCAPG